MKEDESVANFFSPKQLTISNDSLTVIKEQLQQLKLLKPLFIIDNFLVQEPLSLGDKIVRSFENTKIEATVFSDHQGEPTTDHLELSLAIARKNNVDAIIAIGGGSSIDLAKATSALANNKTMNLKNLYSERVLNKLTLIAVPTTAGTGSEATKISVITDSESNIKWNPGNPDLIPDVSLLDASLSLSLPPSFTAYTGMDALTHAIEALLSNKAGKITDEFAQMAIQKIYTSIESVYNNGEDIEKREDMLLGSYYAGIAFSNSSTNLAHALGRVLGAYFKIPHGLSVAILLPDVMIYSKESSISQMAKVGKIMSIEKNLTDEKYADIAIQSVISLNKKFNIWIDVKKIISADDIKNRYNEIVAETFKGNGIDTNRRVPKEEDVREILDNLMERIK